LKYSTRGNAKAFPDKRQAVGLIGDLAVMAIANIRLRDRVVVAPS
jgi:hypothetical protein